MVINKFSFSRNVACRLDMSSVLKCGNPFVPPNRYIAKTILLYQLDDRFEHLFYFEKLIGMLRVTPIADIVIDKNTSLKKLHKQNAFRRYYFH